ncbi:MAG: helix-turn-helix domain-containing protein [Oscillospiraceae bacterium]|nr:helix-turn-helix domain-containing protein [Oscillospiraceae bacterium]
MRFSEKLVQLRRSAGKTQEQVAKIIGVTCRTYQNYESGKMYPKQTEVYGKISALFDVTADYLLSDEDRYIIEAAEKGGSKSKREVQALVSEVGGLFAGGELSEDDKDKVMRTINDLYWRARKTTKSTRRKNI